MKSILIVDDEPGARLSLEAIFKNSHLVVPAASAREAKDILKEQMFDVALLDVIMPEENGIQLLGYIQKHYPNLPVVMVSASTSVKPVVDAMREGAIDYITKPYDVDAIRLTVDEALLKPVPQKQDVPRVKQESKEYKTDEIIGESNVLQRALANAIKAARTSASIIIEGESGTGKELLARYIHNNSHRSPEPFVALHCAAIPENLMESELFGHEKGSFTGADKQKKGRFELAGSGSLFFDEVSEMTLSAQVKLLRVLQEREFVRVGGINVIQSNARIISATNRSLGSMLKDQSFREDLYYRLNVIPIRLPSLRERKEDIPMLVKSFLTMFGEEMDIQTTAFSDKAMNILTDYPWPGNIRELKNIIERMLVLHGEHEIISENELPQALKGQAENPLGPTPLPDTIPCDDGAIANGASLEESINAYERMLVEKALEDANGVQTKAAEILGTTRRILKYRMQKLNISVDKAASSTKETSEKQDPLPVDQPANPSEVLLTEHPESTTAPQTVPEESAAEVPAADAVVDTTNKTTENTEDSNRTDQSADDSEIDIPKDHFEAREVSPHTDPSADVSEIDTTTDHFEARELTPNTDQSADVSEIATTSDHYEARELSPQTDLSADVSEVDTTKDHYEAREVPTPAEPAADVSEIDTTTGSIEATQTGAPENLASLKPEIINRIKLTDDITAPAKLYLNKSSMYINDEE